MWYMPNTIRLIERFKSHPELWDPENNHYKDREKKKAALKSLAEEFGVDVLEVERKLKGLKTQFARELVRSTNSSYKSAWFGFELLQFLKKSKKLTDIAAISGAQDDESNTPIKIPDFNITSENGIDCGSDENNSYIFTEEPEIIDESNFFSLKRPSMYLSTSTCPKRARNCLEDDKNDASEFQRIPQENFHDKERDEYSVFGEHVANKLRHITDPHARSVAQYYISNILFQTEMTNYNKNLTFRAPSDFTLFHPTEK